ncbi:MAG: 3-isopropylmalate dehydratase large subunit [Candidatus Saganbacteria bacterium]|nr:3-isopropylmalate dehydratase large subunit [Candidatus Saganbacteria bacterium]
MPQTISQKILASHAGKKELTPGELIYANIDFCLGNDITAPPAIKEFEKHGATKVFDPEKIVLVPDHFTPEKDHKSAQQVAMMRQFAKKHNLKYFFEIGCMGVEHALLPEMGLVKPGMLIIGADSHTCTYGALGAFSTGVGSTDLAAAMATGEVWLKVPESMKFVFKGKLNKWVEGKDLILYTIGHIGVDGARYKSMEFTGPAISELSIEGRLTMANMAIEAGGKNGIFDPDEKTLAYLKNKITNINWSLEIENWKLLKSDADAVYSDIYEFDCKDIEPQVSFPHLPSNTKPISKVGNIKIDQSVIGSCTNGRIEDLRVAAKILKGKKAAHGVRLIVIPATQKIYLQAIKEGLADIFMEANAMFETPSCGPCLGGHMGILGEGERSIATTNRNFIGRMGHPKSEVYLSNVAIAAASAVLGRIGSPEEL